VEEQNETDLTIDRQKMFNRTLYKTVSASLLLHSATRGKARSWGISFPDFL
jgi:hypothetical protein